ncbi:MAG: hypothetical protein ACOYYJ_06605 [Chloroflexota bacterium]
MKKPYRRGFVNITPPDFGSCSEYITGGGVEAGILGGFWAARPGAHKENYPTVDAIPNLGFNITIGRVGSSFSISHQKKWSGNAHE